MLLLVLVVELLLRDDERMRSASEKWVMQSSRVSVKSAPWQDRG